MNRSHYTDDHVIPVNDNVAYTTDVGNDRKPVSNGEGGKFQSRVATDPHGNYSNEKANGAVIMNVGGTIFSTQESTLNQFPGSRLAMLMTSSPSYNPEMGMHYFDRDPQLFCHILNSYRWGEIHIPKHVCAAGYRKEMEYWGIPASEISPCCWSVYYAIDTTIENIEKLKDVTSQIRSALVRDKGHARKRSWRQKVWLFLDDPYYSKWAMAWYVVYMVIVLISAIIYLLWMLPALRTDPYLTTGSLHHSHTMEKITDLVETDPHIVLFAIDSACMLVFTLEFVIHFAACPEKLKFFGVWYNLLNLFLVASMVTSFMFEIRKDLISSHAVGILYYVLKNVNVLRLVMLARLERQSIELKVLFLAVQTSKRELLLLASLLIVGVCIFGGLIYSAEIHTGKFASIWVSMWWALVTMTTVGYGDYYPEDTPGRVVGAACATIGLLALALPIAVIANSFMEFYHRKVDLQRHVETETQAGCSKQNCFIV